MIYFNSMESFGYDKEEEKEDIVSLSYEKYFQKSLAAENDIRLFNTEITNSYEEYRQTAILLKKQYMSLAKEDGTESVVAKTSFTVNIKNWFIKVWSFLASIFQKIVDCVINMIKTMILYIQKHMLMKNSIYAKLKEKSISFTDPNSSADFIKALGKVMQNKVQINTLENNNNSHKYMFSDLHDHLNNDVLKNFVTQKIIVDNKKSTLNTDALKNMLVNEIYQGKTAEESLKTLELNFTLFNIMHMYCGEVGDDLLENKLHGNTYNKISDIIVNNGSIRNVANYIVFECPDINRVSVPLLDFFDITVLDLSLSNIRNCLALYENDAKLVIGKGGYLDILTEILKRYKSSAVNDSKHITEMKNFIIQQMNKLGGGKTDDVAISHRFQRFTKLLLSVQKIKNNFIALRQCVIGNILTAFSIEDKALSAVIFPKEYTKEEIDKIVKDSNGIKDSIIGGKFGSDPSSLANTYAEEIPPTPDPNLSDENLKQFSRNNKYE